MSAGTMVPQPARADRVSIDDSPVNRLVIIATVSVFGGIFVDGYILGVIGSALGPASRELQLSALGEGLISSSALIGIFIGGLLFGRVADRFGRKSVFFWCLMGFTVLSLTQLFVVGTWDLVAIRVLLGVLIGVEYAVGTALLAEFVPKNKRSVLLGSISLFWFLGFVAALVLGHFWNPDSWRWLLASSAVPALITLLMRLQLPESPRWLQCQGRIAEAEAIVDKHWGPQYTLPPVIESKDASFRAFFRDTPWRRVVYPGLFWACQVAPLFTIFAFIPQVLTGIGLGNGLGTDLLMNGLQIAGGVLGIWLLWLLPRRAMVIWTFVATAGFLLVLGLWHGIPAIPAIIIFGAFVLIFTASTNIQYVYPPEMYETRFRSTGVGMAAAISRIGAAIAVFLFPVTMAELGTNTTLVLAAIFPIIGLIASVLWAPETKGKDIDIFA